MQFIFIVTPNLSWTRDSAKKVAGYLYNVAEFEEDDTEERRMEHGEEQGEKEVEEHVMMGDQQRQEAGIPDRLRGGDIG